MQAGKLGRELPAHAIDIFPTIAAAAGLKAPENLQGINLLNAEARAQAKGLYSALRIRSTT